MNTRFAFGACAALALSGAAFGQFGAINSLAEAPYWFANYFGRSNLITNNGLSSIRFEDRNFTGGGFANRHHAALAVNNVPFQFQNNQGFRFDVDVNITGPGRTEAGIWIGTAPSYPSSFNADVGQFVLLPNNGGEAAAFGSLLPFFSNNEAENLDQDRAVRNTVIHLTMLYVAAPNPYIQYGINGVFTRELNSGGFFPGILNNSLMGVYVQGPNGDPTAGDVDVTYSNLSIQIPAPGAFALLGLGGLMAGRRRR